MKFKSLGNITRLRKRNCENIFINLDKKVKVNKIHRFK